VNNSKKISILIALLIISIFESGFAQSKALQKLVDNPKKLEKAFSANTAMRNEIKNFQIKKGYCTEADYKLPKKIGILSFYVKDQEHKIYSSTYSRGFNSTTKTTTISTIKLTKDGVNLVAQNIYRNTIDDIKAMYKEQGIELLEPHEYLDTDKKRALYNNFEIKGSKFQNMFNKKFAKDKRNSAVARGYRLFDLNDAKLTLGKFIRSRDELLMGLELDAYLVISLEFSVGRDALMAVKSNLIYKSPTAGRGKGKNYGGDFPDRAFAAIAQKNIWAKKATYSGIIKTEKVEYTNKKGKKKKKTMPTGLDENVYFVTKTVAKRSLQSLLTWINRKK
jgi:hypothetical protein